MIYCVIIFEFIYSRLEVLEMGGEWWSILSNYRVSYQVDNDFSQLLLLHGHNVTNAWRWGGAHDSCMAYHCGA
jgi:hypothetical protein